MKIYKSPFFTCLGKVLFLWDADWPKDWSCAVFHVCRLSAYSKNKA